MFGVMQKTSRNMSRYLWARVHFHHSLSRKSVKFKYDLKKNLKSNCAEWPVHMLVCNNSNNSVLYDVKLSQKLPTNYNSPSPSQHKLPQSFPNYDEDISVIADEEEPLPSMKAKQYENYLFKSIKSMSSAEDLLQFYEEYSNDMNDQHAIQVLANLKKLVSLGKEVSVNIKENPIFMNLAYNLWKCSPTLDTAELLRILGPLIELEVPSRSKIVQKILQLLRHNMNNLNERELIYFDFLLGKLPYIGLTKALKDSIPFLLDNLLHQGIKDDTLNLSEYSKLLSIYAKGTGNNISILLTELYEHGKMTADDPIKSILWNLLDAQNNLATLTKQDNEKIDVLTDECLEILSTCIHQLSVGEIKTTLFKLSAKKGGKNENRKNLNFLNSVTKLISLSKEWGIKDYCTIISLCLKLRYVSMSLNYRVIEEISKSSEEVFDKTKMNLDNIPSFIRALAICQPDHPQLSKVLDVLMQQRKIKENQINKFWLNFSLDLLALNYVNEDVISFCVNDECIQKYFKDYSLNLILFNEALVINNSNLRVPSEVLERCKKLCLDLQPKPSRLSDLLSQVIKDHFISGVTTNEGIYIDHIIIMNSSGQIQPIKVKNHNSNNSIENYVDIIEPSQMIAILDVPSNRTLMPSDYVISTVRLKQQILTAKGYKVLTVLDTVLQRLAEIEQPAFITAQLKSIGANVV